MKYKVGTKYNRLIVLAKLGRNKHNQQLYLFHCDCGTDKVIAGYLVKSGNTQSCGCKKVETSRENGLSKRYREDWEDRPFNILQGMKSRCYNVNDKNYANYGGRGIEICSEWLEDFQAFMQWVRASNYSKDLSIDRIDNDGNYEPNNCRWATMKEQSNNTRFNRTISINGVIKNATQWAEISGINVTTILFRLNSGWDSRDLLNEPNTRRRY